MALKLKTVFFTQNVINSYWCILKLFEALYHFSLYLLCYKLIKESHNYQYIIYSFSLFQNSILGLIWKIKNLILPYTNVCFFKSSYWDIKNVFKSEYLQNYNNYTHQFSSLSAILFSELTFAIEKIQSIQICLYRNWKNIKHVSNSK